MEHIPDSGLQDIQEVDEEGVEEDVQEEVNSEDDLDEEDGSREAMLNQDGVISDENDIEPFSKSRDPYPCSVARNSPEVFRFEFTFKFNLNKIQAF